MSAAYDVFLSHAWKKDGKRSKKIYDALTQAGLRVWFDAAEINDFASITHAVTEGLAKSKALVAYYSKTYPLRRACQWELTAAFLAAQTEGDPRRRVLVINPEKGADHIHPIELRDAKYRNAPKTDGEMQQLVQAIVKHVAAVSGPLADIHPLTAPTWYGMTPVGSTRFVGRLKEMWEVHSLLHAGDVAQVSYATAATGGIGRISGLGGVGKSLLAEEYALHFGAAYPGGVFWVRAYGNNDAKTALGPEERQALRADQVRQMAERLGIDTHGMTAEQIEGALARKIASEGKPCLWVVDDVPNGLDGDALRHWFAPHPLARTLVTTRSREYGALAKGIDLSVLTPDEALQLLTSRRALAGKDEEEQAEELAKDLGYHALALDVTASALLSSVATRPFSDFRAKLARPDKDALALAETLADALPNGHEKSIAQTMLRSLRDLPAEGMDFLRLASVLAVAPIPASLVTTVFQIVAAVEKARELSLEEAEVTNIASHEDAEDRGSLALKQVTSASLADIAGAHQNARTVHTLVSRTVRFQEKDSPERTNDLRSAVVGVLAHEISQAAEDPRLHKGIELQIAHARQIISSTTTASDVNLLSFVAEFDRMRGVFPSARRLFEREVEFRLQHQGPDHQQTLNAMQNLAATRLAQGDLSGACTLQKQTLAIHRKLLPPGHPTILRAMSDLGATLLWQGDLGSARSLQQEVLAVQLEELGPEHPHTITSMLNLGSTLYAQGDWVSARELQERVLATSLKVLERDHPDTLMSMSNLALTLLALNDLKEARRLQEEALALRRQVLGAKHPDTLTSMNNLALTLSADGDPAGAQKLFEEALDIGRDVQGPEHPDTLTTMSNLALTLSSQGDLDGAHKLHEEVLAISLRVLGPEHPNTLCTMYNLAQTRCSLGDRDGGRRLQENTLRLSRRVLGADHPNTLSSMVGLALELYEQGDLDGAGKLQKEALSIQREALGPKHPSTLTSAWCLFVTCRKQNRLEEARTVLRQDLLWLLDCDPASLGARERKVREHVAQVVNKSK
jgi:tetratricopeptide (TPR) repeat protein